MLDRRRFLARAMGSAGAAIAAPIVSAHPFDLPQLPAAPPLPSPDLHARNDEAYWAEVRRQFLIPAGQVHLNNGTVGCCPLPVLRAVFEGYLETEKLAPDDPETYPLWGYGPANEFRDPLARLVGCSRDELALVRNATEANAYIANGVDLKAGDEVLISDQEHPSGEQPWRLRARRQGIRVNTLALPKPARSAAEILNRVHDALTPRTRVIFVSHVTTATGLVMPVKEICALARSKGILSAVDGAQVTGMMRLEIRELGCDLYSSSMHKWLQAPKGTGFLYVRDEVIDRVWNTIATHGWDEPALRAERFQHLGTSNLPALWGLRSAIELAERLGLERIESRQRALADWLLKEMLARGAESWSSADPALRCAIATVNVPPIPRMELERWLWSRHRILIRGSEPSKLRLSTPYYLLRADLERFLEAFDEFARGRRPAAASVEPG